MKKGVNYAANDMFELFYPIRIGVVNETNTATRIFDMEYYVVFGYVVTEAVGLPEVEGSREADYSKLEVIELPMSLPIFGLGKYPFNGFLNPMNNPANKLAKNGDGYVEEDGVLVQYTLDPDFSKNGKYTATDVKTTVVSHRIAPRQTYEDIKRVLQGFKGVILPPSTIKGKAISYFATNTRGSGRTIHLSQLPEETAKRVQKNKYINAYARIKLDNGPEFPINLKYLKLCSTK